jgi:transcriptional regulator with XRE-family HTH domain
MSDTKPLIGAILKNERIQSGRSQKDICYGICVPSYLSKIENGTVKPDENILAKLYKRLDIEYIGDSELYKNLEKKIQDFYFEMEYDLDREKLYLELCLYDKQISCSELAIDWLIIKGFWGQDVYDVLSHLKNNMTPIQKAYYQINDLDRYDDISDKVRAYEEACNVINSSFSFNKLCELYIMTSEYSKIHQLENRIVSLALEEGNTKMLADYYATNGTAYACVDMEEMMLVNYMRAIHLLQNTEWVEMITDIYYNIGATYITLKKYDQALEYLLKPDKVQEVTCFLSNHKIAIAYIRNGEVDKATIFLERMKKYILNNSGKETLEDLMYKEAVWECKKDFKLSRDYLSLLENLIKKIEKEGHFGYLFFYHEVITEAYISQRQYKKAYEFQQTISTNR